ncbi:MAG: hypothetical protein GY953_36200, partial [bacterium]|nr:hypothetical protein [bacterium]
MSVQLGALAEAEPAATGGFLIGAGPAGMDYRGRAIVFGNSGKNGGLIAGINGSGDLVVLDNEASLEPLPLRLSGSGADSLSADRELTLRVEIEPSGTTYRLGLALHDGQGTELQKGEFDGISAERLTGNLALASHPGAKPSTTSFWFRDWHVAGAKVAVNDQATFGPVL